MKLVLLKALADAIMSLASAMAALARDDYPATEAALEDVHRILREQATELRGQAA